MSFIKKPVFEFQLHLINSWEGKKMKFLKTLKHFAFTYLKGYFALEMQSYFILTIFYHEIP